LRFGWEQGAERGLSSYDSNNHELFPKAFPHGRQILLLADKSVTKYFAMVKNRFLLIKCITMGALSFPTPFFIYFFITNVDPNEISYRNRFVLISILLLSGAVIGLASYYKDSAIAALKDWYPSDKP
jgi:hypothetical protein